VQAGEPGDPARPVRWTGEQLPPEAEFAAQFGRVRHEPCGKALATLRQQGPGWRTRRGRTGGTFVPPARVPRRSPGLRETACAGHGRPARCATWSTSSFAVGPAPPPGSPPRRGRREPTCARLYNASCAGCPSRPSLGVADPGRTAGSTSRSAPGHPRSERLTRLEVGLQTQLGELLWLPPEPAGGDHGPPGPTEPPRPPGPCRPRHRRDRGRDRGGGRRPGPDASPKGT